MHRSRSAAAFAVVSVVLIIASVLLAATLGNRLDKVFGGLLKPLVANELVAKVGKVKLYSRDIAMLRLLEKARQSGDDMSDAELLDELIELTILNTYATESGIAVDSAAIKDALEEIGKALDTERGRRLAEVYKEEFARSDKEFDSDLRAAVEREQKVHVLLLTLYYSAVAQGMISEELTDQEAMDVLRGKLLPMLRAKTIIEIYS